MSIDINWAALTNPSPPNPHLKPPPSPPPHPTKSSTSNPSQNDLALSIRDFIHAKFQTLTLPRFIRRVHVHDFDFGTQAPEVTILDVTDPLDEFYESDDDDDDNDEDESSPPPQQQDIGATTRQEEGLTSIPRAAAAPRAAVMVGGGTPAGLGIGAAASSLSYFQLNAGAKQGLLSGGHGGAATPWGPATAPPHDPPPQIPTSPTPSKSRDRDLDLQTTLHIQYDGTMSLGLTAEVMLDYPMPSFVGIPLELRICGVRFDGVGVVAYLRGKQMQEDGGVDRGGGTGDGNGDGGDEKGRGKVKFCFLGEEEARVLLAGEGEGEGEGERRGEMEGMEGNGGGGGGLLKEIRIESEIGRKGEGKQVLKNVGKVERFVLEQVRRIFEEEFVWPSFWTVLV